MNLAKSRTLHPQLRDEEVVVVENAIRLAIDSIINVLYGVNSARTHEYQRMVADRDKEIRRLEGRLGEIEHELQGLRRQHSPPGSQGEQSGFESGCLDAETTAGQQECEMSISCNGSFRPTPSHVSSQSHESAFPSSPSRVCLDQTCTSHSSETSGASEAAGHLPPSPSSFVVKEEPCDMDTVLIKWEMSEERFGERQESTDSPCQDEGSPALKKKQERKKVREKPEADPEGEQLRIKKRTVPMSELPEEAQRQKRAAWRAASRRYYARKIARQQANPSRVGPFPHIPHIPASQFSQPTSIMDRRRRTLISELPEESQTLQREAWRAASKRYYARKVARHQSPDPTQYGHLLQT